MQKFQGIGVSPGVATGEVLVIDSEGFRITRRFVARDAIEQEIERLTLAIAAAGEDIERHRETVAGQLGEHYGAIFGAHLQMLRDTRLRAELEEMIRERHYSPEYAVSRTLRRYAKVFQSLDNTFMAERATDIYDIEKRLLSHLLGQRREELSHLTSPVVILAHNLTPSETAALDPKFVRGFVTEVGGPGSHTAIVAAGMGIPAVVGAGNLLTEVSGGETIIIDGDHGLVIVQPDEEAVARYRHEVEVSRTLAERLESLRELPTVTTDNVRIELLGNIEFPAEADACLQRCSDGIGLYRTEFLYLNAETEPTEEIHFDAYAAVAREMQGKPVCIRTLDLGADKMAQLPMPDDERNPVLGLRSIRLSLRNLELFRTQLRAIVRASALGNVRIMFPLISTLLELRQAKMVLSDVMEDLAEHGVRFDRNLAVGMMVEVPSAVLLLDRFVREVDFISIGTNDLIQYTLAVDRGNKDVASLYNAADPAVLRQIESSILVSNQAGIPVNCCGQMSGSPTFTMLLLGLGLRQFSIPPGAMLEVRKVIRSVTLEQCRDLAQRAMTLENAREIKNYLNEELKKVAPDLAL